ncbi:MAG: HlyC/CorC family transporter [Gammaproteobacteria bacterium]|nr:HlyC/CorC family transporter [Gammaproteobacteria bacterium]
MNNTYSVAAIIILLAVNAFFVAAEFALVKAKVFRIAAAANQGSAAAILTQRIQENLESYLAACQLGITMASLGLGWVGEPVVAALLEPLFIAAGMPTSLLHPVSFISGFLLFSALHIVIGEQVPKTFAIRKAEPVSIWCAYPLHLFYLLAYPLNWMLNRASGAILAMFNVEEATHADVLSNDEIRGVIETSEKHGDLNTDKATMLNNMFDFDTLTVQQIMVPRNNVDSLNLQIAWEKNEVLIQSTKHSRFPVFDGDTDNPVGTVLVKDLYCDLIAPKAPKDPEQALKTNLREPLLVPEGQPIAKLFETMRSTRKHMALVVDEYGGFAGIVTLEDVLEEIVGEIADELDIDEPEQAVSWEGDHWECDGLATIPDIDRELGAGLAETTRTNTVNGLLMEELGQMPRRGDEVVVNGYQFKVVSEIGNRVGKVHIFHVVSGGLDDVDEQLENAAEAVTDASISD